MLFSTSTLAIAGALLGILAGAAMLMFELSGLTAAGTEQTADVMGVLAMVLGVVALVAVAVSDRHHTLARAVFLIVGIAGFLVAALLWIPAGLLLILAGLTGVLTRPEPPQTERRPPPGAE